MPPAGNRSQISFQYELGRFPVYQDRFRASSPPFLKFFANNFTHQVHADGRLNGRLHEKQVRIVGYSRRENDKRQGGPRSANDITAT